VEVIVIRRLLKGFSANVYSQGITIVVQLIGVPILLHAWGAQVYGEWLILFAVSAYLSGTDLGFSQTAANDMTQSVSRGNYAEALSVFQSSAAIVSCAFSGGLIFVTALLFGVPLRFWPQLSTMSVNEMRLVLWFLAAEGLVRLGNGISSAGFRAASEYSLHVYLSSTWRLLQFVAIWIVALSGGGPVVAAASFFGVYTLATPTVAALLIRRHPWLRFGFAHVQRSELRRLFKPALANVSMPVAQALNIQGMVLVVGIVLGPLAVVTFSTLRTLTRLALQIVLAVSHAAEPELAAAYGAGNQALMQSIFLHALRAGLWLAFVAAAGLALFGSFILQVWTHNKVLMDERLFYWLLASAVATTLWYSGFIILKAANRHLRAAFLYSLSAAAAVVVAAALLALTNHLADAGFSLLMMDGMMSIYILSAASRIVGMSPGVCLARAINPYPIIRLAMSKAHVY
jgi:O-antigen/teichoic acid export membrane protein